MTDTTKPIAALFDFDGVVVNTEPQYSLFWGEQGRKYHPEIEDFSIRVKGTTLTQIFDKYFAGEDKIQQQIRQELTDFESNMNYEYVSGVVDFLQDLRRNHICLAVVTSSDRIKMENVYRFRPELKDLFDRILIAEDFARSKPFPDCYLLGAKVFDTEPGRCVVFEDSFNGLKSGNAAGMTVVGLATTNPKEAIMELSSLVIEDFRHFTCRDMLALIEPDTDMKLL